MALIYSDNEPPPQFPIRFDRMDPHKPYLKHYANYMYLLFIERKGTFQEKRQATKEIRICQRKMTFWEKHPGFNIDTIAKAKHDIHVQWGFNP